MSDNLFKITKHGSLAKQELKIYNYLINKYPTTYSDVIVSLKYSKNYDNTVNFIMEKCTPLTEHIKDFRLIYTTKNDTFKITNRFDNIIYNTINQYSRLLSMGILHRDLKPQNVLICSNTLKLCDFDRANFIEHYKPKDTNMIIIEDIRRFITLLSSELNMFKGRHFNDKEIDNYIKNKVEPITHIKQCLQDSLEYTDLISCNKIFIMYIKINLKVDDASCKIIENHLIRGKNGGNTNYSSNCQIRRNKYISRNITRRRKNHTIRKYCRQKVH